jgi:hypothetical protein
MAELLGGSTTARSNKGLCGEGSIAAVVGDEAGVGAGLDDLAVLLRRCLMPPGRSGIESPMTSSSLRLEAMVAWSIRSCPAVGPRSPLRSDADPRYLPSKW